MQGKNSFSFSLQPQTLNTRAINQLVPISECKTITQSLVKKHFVNGRPEDVEKISKIFMEIRQIDPLIAEYVDIVFNYLPGFKVEFTTHADLLKRNGKEHDTSLKLGAMYISRERAILIPIDGLINYEHYTFIHEFRHALSDTIHIARGLSTTKPSWAIYFAECYFPATDAERAKVAAHLKKGDKAILDLRKLLEKELDGKLTKKETTHLANLRKKIKPYLAFYKPGDPIRIKFSLAQESLVREIMSKDVDVNKLFNYPLSTHGAYRFLSWKKTENDIQAFAVPADPLWAVIYEHERMFKLLKHYYSENERVYEKDAFLFQILCPPLLREFYPQHLQHNRKFIDGTSFPERVISPINPDGFIYLADMLAENNLTAPQQLLSNVDLEVIFNFVGVCIFQKEKLDQAENGIKILVKNGYKYKQTQLYVAEMYFLRGEYQLACQTFRPIVEGGGAIVSADTMLRFGQALFHIKRYQDVEVICNDFLPKLPALSGSSDVLAFYKNEFEKLLTENKKAQAESQKQTSVKPSTKKGSVKAAKKTSMPKTPPDPIEKSQSNGDVRSTAPSFINIGTWIGAGIGTLRKWLQVSNGRLTISTPIENFSAPVKTVNREQKDVQLQTCKVFIHQGDTGSFDKEILVCNTPGSVVSVYPVNNTHTASCLPAPDAQQPGDFLRPKLMGDTYKVSSCRALGDTVVCDGEKTTLIYQPKLPYQSVANSSHIGNSIGVAIVSGKMAINFGSWIKNIITGQQHEEESTPTNTSKRLKTLVNQFQRRYPKYHRHLYLQAFRSLQKFELKDNEDPFDQLNNHLKRIANGEFSNRHRQDKREKEGKDILRCLSRLHLEPKGTEVYKLLPVEIQEYLQDFAFDAYQLCQKDPFMCSSKQIASTSVASRTQSDQSNQLPQKVTEKLIAFGMLGVQNKTTPNLPKSVTDTQVYGSSIVTAPRAVTN